MQKSSSSSFHHFSRLRKKFFFLILNNNQKNNFNTVKKKWKTKINIDTHTNTNRETLYNLRFKNWNLEQDKMMMIKDVNVDNNKQHQQIINIQQQPKKNFKSRRSSSLSSSLLFFLDHYPFNSREREWQKTKTSLCGCVYNAI